MSNDKSKKIAKYVGHEFYLKGYKYTYKYMFSCIDEEMKEKIISKIDSDIIFFM